MAAVSALSANGKPGVRRRLVIVMTSLLLVDPGTKAIRRDCGIVVGDNDDGVMDP